MPGSPLPADAWFDEALNTCDIYRHKLTQVLVQKKTKFQDLIVIESGLNGKALILDGLWQSCTGDEFLYHEPLVHPAFVLHGGPRNVLILGGGEGAAAREALKWKSVQRVVMVDLDQEVIEACRTHLREMHQGSFDDPRTELVIDDALRFLQETKEKWDVIISDLSEPIEHGPSFKLFTKEYFAQAKKVLADDGFFVVQAGGIGPDEMAMHVKLNRTVDAVFDHTASYGSCVPTFATLWGFVLGSDQPIDVLPDPQAIDRLLDEQVGDTLRMFDGRTMLGLLQVPKHIRKAIEAQTEIYTQMAPPKSFGTGQLTSQ